MGTQTVFQDRLGRNPLSRQLEFKNSAYFAKTHTPKMGEWGEREWQKAWLGPFGRHALKTLATSRRTDKAYGPKGHRGRRWSSKRWGWSWLTCRQSVAVAQYALNEEGMTDDIGRRRRHIISPMKNQLVTDGSQIKASR